MKKWAIIKQNLSFVWVAKESFELDVCLCAVGEKGEE
jgi:hypothetical protein